MAAPTVTPTANADRFATPPYQFVLWGALSGPGGTAWMLRWDMALPDALFGGALAAGAANIALLLLAGRRSRVRARSRSGSPPR